jgi:hypothetical protein
MSNINNININKQKRKVNRIEINQKKNNIKKQKIKLKKLEEEIKEIEIIKQQENELKKLRKQEEELKKKEEELEKKKKDLIKIPELDDCPICFEQIVNNEIILGCKHKLCNDCWEMYKASKVSLISNIQLMNIKCPICRQLLNTTTKQLLSHELEDLLEKLPCDTILNLWGEFVDKYPNRYRSMTDWLKFSKEFMR